MTTVENLEARLGQLVTYVEAIKLKADAVEVNADVNTVAVNELKDFLTKNGVGAFRAEVEAMKVELNKKSDPKSGYDHKYGKNFQIQKFDGKSSEGFRSWSQEIEILVKAHGFSHTSSML